MTNQEIQEIIKRNYSFLNQGRMEGAIWALIGMTFYLILVAAIIENL